MPGPRTPFEQEFLKKYRRQFRDGRKVQALGMGMPYQSLLKKTGRNPAERRPRHGRRHATEPDH